MTDDPRARVLVLWNQVEDDCYETLQRHAIPLPWDPGRLAAEVRTAQQEMDELLAAVREAGYEVICVNARDDLEILLGALRLYRPDVVFNLIEYFHDDQGLEANIVGLYELLGVPYTGSAGYALSLCQRKHHTKQLLEAAGLPTPWHFVVESLDSPILGEDALEPYFPLIVKPALEDASGGIDAGAVVSGYRALLERIQHVLAEFDGPVLVEQYIDGRELHVAILGNQDPEVLPLFEMGFDESELDPDGGWRPRIISFDGKWDPLSKDFYTLDPVCPAADVEPELERLLGALALSAYRLTGCRDYARIDMRVGAEGVPYILEVNPNPDLTDGSAFMMCAAASGRSYAETLGEIVELARARAGELGRESDPAEPDAPTDLLNRKYWRWFENA